MKRIFFAAVIAAVTSASASAADLAFKSGPAPMVQAAYNWTGFYIGVNGGGGIAGSTHNDPDCVNCSSTKFQDAFGTVGAGAGFNYQFGHTVLGIEGDYNWASVDKTKFYGLDNGVSAGTTQFRMNEFATIRARGGLALDRTFIYVTAGLAFAHVRNETLIGAAAVPVSIRQQASENTWKTGLAVGGGVEFAFSQNWSMKGEYLYMMFEDSEASLLNVLPGRTTCSFNRDCRMNYAETVQTARIGLNYKFGY